MQYAGVGLYRLVYADDLLLVACSTEQAQRLLDLVARTLQAIGLTVAVSKCSYLKSPGLPAGCLVLQGHEIPEVDSLVFLRVLLGFQVSCLATLCHKLSKVAAAYHARYSILTRATNDLVKRLMLFTTFITPRWRWMSCAFRPTQAIAKTLDTLQTTYMLRLAPDPFLSGVSNFVSRRRAARIIAQLCNVHRWSYIHLIMFYRFWGHAARLDPGGQSPLSSIMHIRGPDWYLRNVGVIRRLPGNWPDAVRLLQLAWEAFLARMGLQEPQTWVQMARNRQNWSNWTLLVGKEQASSGLWYQSLHAVDLHDRQLVRKGNHFSLRPARLPPVETPHPCNWETYNELVDQAAKSVLSAPERYKAWRLVSGKQGSISWATNQPPAVPSWDLGQGRDGEVRD